MHIGVNRSNATAPHLSIQLWPSFDELETRPSRDQCFELCLLSSNSVQIVYTSNQLKFYFSLKYNMEVEC